MKKCEKNFANSKTSINLANQIKTRQFAINLHVSHNNQ